MKRRSRPRKTPEAAPEVAPAALQRTPLPFEVLMGVLHETFLLDQGMAARLLALNSGIRKALHPIVYTRVELYTASALASFAQLVRTHPDVARTVRALWIGPRTARSDLLSILSVPLPGDSAYLDQLREEVYANTRLVLRACRRLQDVALSGSLVSKAIVHSYGTACQPVQLTSVNPHSFICGFDAPIFRKVESLTVCDINLSVTEAEAIRRLPALRTLQYTSPKDYGDTSRDVWVLRKLLALDDDELTIEEHLERLMLDQPASCIAHLTYRAASERAALVVSALEGARDHTSPPRTLALAPARLTPTFVEEWEALRDLVFNAQGEYSRAALGDDVGSWVDPSDALEMLRLEWRQRSTGFSAEPTASASGATRPRRTENR
ncbi:hypothetical protein CBS9595_003670 [Malassezia furfur]|nr:hypothetical protein CBS9595_003670 [Malassezia furfur]